MFKLNGLGGFLILVLALVAIWAGLMTFSLQTQAHNATNYYQSNPGE
ncbi:MAG: DUF4006 family protein [bacterium]|nr:DUF4006 family protein [bacterium]